jgi:glycosyltransferase involved in cell wall biosynthesis
MPIAPPAQGAPRLLLNGRFLTRAPTGVDRTAQQLVRGFQRLTREGWTEPLVLDVAVPRDAPGDVEIRNRLDLGPEARIIRSRWRGYFWEQFVLAKTCPDQCLLSLCNVGPLLRRNQFVLMHDAQVFDTPESYGFAFRCAYRFLLPSLARRVRFLATVSRYSRERLRHHGVGVRRKIELLPNGIDHLAEIPSDAAILSRLSLRSGEYVLAIGRPERHKNIPMLLSACAAREDRALPLVLIRSNDARPGLTGDTADGVVFVGRVTDGELKALYENARLFLFPSLTEGFGLPALEAMACGCPVIASSGGAIPEVTGDAAVYCHPSDTFSWTRRIEELAASPERLVRLGQAGLDRAAGFRWTASASRLLRIVGMRSPDVTEARHPGRDPDSLAVFGSRLAES